MALHCSSYGSEFEERTEVSKNTSCLSVSSLTSSLPSPRRLIHHPRVPCSPKTIPYVFSHVLSHCSSYSGQFEERIEIYLIIRFRSLCSFLTSTLPSLLFPLHHPRAPCSFNTMPRVSFRVLSRYSLRGNCFRIAIAMETVDNIGSQLENGSW